jgi:transcriptional regulator GlxA family with amidase domain
LASPIGSGLQRYVTFVWGELSRGGGILSSDFVAQELEDGLISALALALLEEGSICSSRDETRWADRRITRAEDYLLAHLRKPISRAELAEVAGISIRAISRGFAKRHGMGPMAFLKRRRLEAARADLCTAEPGSLSVSEVAFRYGFAELSSFSAAYKAIFHEAPSETLRK